MKQSQGQKRSNVTDVSDVIYVRMSLCAFRAIILGGFEDGGARRYAL